MSAASADPVPVLLLVAAGVAYLRWATDMRRRGRPWSVHRKAAFVYGLLALLVGVQSGLGHVAGSDFTAGAVRVLLCGVVAPALVVAGAPLGLAATAGGPRVRRAVSGFVGWGGWRWLANPLSAWVLYGGSLVCFYYSGVYPRLAGGGPVPVAAEAELFATGLLWFWAVSGSGPEVFRRPGYPRRLLQVVLGLPWFTILGMALESTTSGSTFPGTDVGSVQLGGALLWIGAEGAMILTLLAVWIEWLRADERRAREVDQLSEAAANRQLALWRAARDAARDAAAAGP